MTCTVADYITETGLSDKNVDTLFGVGLQPICAPLVPNCGQGRHRHTSRPGRRPRKRSFSRGRVMVANGYGAPPKASGRFSVLRFILVSGTLSAWIKCDCRRPMIDGAGPVVVHSNGGSGRPAKISPTCINTTIISLTPSARMGRIANRPWLLQKLVTAVRPATAPPLEGPAGSVSITAISDGVRKRKRPVLTSRSKQGHRNSALSGSRPGAAGWMEQSGPAGTEQQLARAICSDMNQRGHTPPIHLDSGAGKNCAIIMALADFSRPPTPDFSEARGRWGPRLCSPNRRLARGRCAGWIVRLRSAPLQTPSLLKTAVRGRPGLCWVVDSLGVGLFPRIASLVQSRFGQHGSKSTKAKVRLKTAAKARENAEIVCPLVRRDGSRKPRKGLRQTRCPHGARPPMDCLGPGLRIR